MSLHRYLEKVSVCLCRNNGMVIPEAKSSLVVSFSVSDLTHAVFIPHQRSIQSSGNDINGR